jgi:hypothetical protein
MDDHKRSRREKHSSSNSFPSQSEKEEMAASLNCKLPKLVQPSPLKPPLKTFAPLMEEPGATAPLFNASSNSTASFRAVYPNNPGQDGVSSGRFGSPGTRVNSSLVNDMEQAARVEYRYQQSVQRSRPAPGWTDPYSAPFSDPNAYSHGFHASYEVLKRENQVPPTLKRILDRFGGHLQSLLMQG